MRKECSSHSITTLNDPAGKKPFENITRKGVNAGKEVFLPSSKHITFFVNIIYFVICKCHQSGPD